MSAVWEHPPAAEATPSPDEAWLHEDEDEFGPEVGHELTVPSGELLAPLGEAGAGQLWVPGADRVANPRSRGGTYVGGPWRFVFHTVEGRPSAADFRRLAARHRTPPHLWAMPTADLLLQTIPLDRSAYALARPGQVHTNRRQAVQVEVWGFARDMAAAPSEVLEWLARRVLAPVTRLVPINLANVRPAGSERCYGLRSPCRMSAEQWQRFDGVCGHKDVPDNAHWDPGGLDMTAVAVRARALLAGGPAQREDDAAGREAPRTIFSWPREPAGLSEGGRAPSTPWAEEWAAESRAGVPAGWVDAEEPAGGDEFAGYDEGDVIGEEEWEAPWSDGEASWEVEGGVEMLPVGPPLRRGSTGGAVAALQRVLAGLGHPLTADGSFGARTEQAVRAFQAGAGLTVDGVVGPATRARLVAAAPAGPPPAVTVAAGTVGGTPGAGIGAPGGDVAPAALGTLVLRAPGRTFTYRFTPQDLVWTAKLLVHEAGGHDEPGKADNAAVLWAMFNRYALFAHTKFRTFSGFVRAYSTTLQPVLLSKGAAARHAHKPPTEYVRTGGLYPVDKHPRGQQIPRGQLRKHLDIQAAPWNSVKPSARALATRALSGRLPNPGIGLASEFASTLVYWQQQNKTKKRPSPEEWRRFTMAYAAKKTKDKKEWRWIGDVPGIDQMKNAFFLDLRAASLPADAVQVVAPGATASETEWESPWRDDVSGPTDEDWQAEQEQEDDLLGEGDEEADETDDGSSAFADETALEDADSYEGDDPRGFQVTGAPGERAPDGAGSQALPDGGPGGFLAREWQAETRSWFGRALERSILLADIAAKQRNEKELTNKIFFLRHPSRRNTTIGRDETALAREWVAIRDQQVVPLLLAGPREGPIHGGEQVLQGVPRGAVLSPLAITRRGLRRSPSRRHGSVAAVVVHNTGRGVAARSRAGGYASPAVAYALDYYLNDPEGGYPHYVIDLNGTIYATCDERFVAAHAGWAHVGGAGLFRGGWTAPTWWSRVWFPFGARTPLDLLPGGTTSPNTRTIGIELIILPSRTYTDEQYRSLARLVVDLARRHPDLTIDRAPGKGLLGHEDFTPVLGEKGRADAGGGWDPGAHRDEPYFHWNRLWSEIRQVAPGFGGSEAEIGDDGRAERLDEMYGEVQRSVVDVL